MNYEKASDFELSAAILESVGMSDAYLEPSSDSEATCRYYRDEMLLTTRFDINNWADIGPLIDDHSISLININESGNLFACSNVEFDTICMSPDGNDNGVSCFNAKNESYCKNQKRAAAICYLKMMERESLT